MRVVWRWWWFCYSFDGTDVEDDGNNDDVEQDVKDDLIVDSRRRLEQHNIMSSSTGATARRHGALQKSTSQACVGISEKYVDIPDIARKQKPKLRARFGGILFREKERWEGDRNFQTRLPARADDVNPKVRCSAVVLTVEQRLWLEQNQQSEGSPVRSEESEKRHETGPVVWPWATETVGAM
ncbi:unnamed protein product [Symbiodinium microadriaticum]|nr:unnamed protein product [Symbiodinium microadriaticum]